MVKHKLSAALVVLAIATTGTLYWLGKLSATPWTSSFKMALALACTLAVCFILLLAHSFFTKGKIWRKGIAFLLTLPVIIILIVTIILVSDSTTAYTFLTNVILKTIPESKRPALDALPYSLTKEQWLEDIQYLKEKLPTHHANLFLYLSEKEFYSAISSLEQDINTLTDQEISWEVCRIISKVRDGHTQVISVPFNVPPFQDSRLFPLRIFKFEDGWYVTEADKDNKQLIGSKLLAIGNRSIEKAVTEVSPYVPGENEYYKMQWAFPYLLNASLLKYRNIISSSEEALFTFVNSKGKKFTQALRPVLAPLYLRWFRSTRQLDDKSRQNKLNQSYWYEYDAEKKSVFVQINQAASQQARPSLKQFSTEVDSLIVHNVVDRLIVDLRNCNGGDNSRLGPLVELVQNPKINQAGKLFVLIGRQTFSGGVSLAAAIERNSKATFVGEPSGSGPNQCGDVQRLTLPNSKLMINVSGRYHQQSYANDRRLQITPTVRTGYTYTHWLAKVDADKAFAEQYRFASNEKQTVDAKIQAAILGRYKFDEEKVAEVKLEENSLWLEVSDFRTFARTELHASGRIFTTDIPHVTVSVGQAKNELPSTLLITWTGRTDTLMRLPIEYKSPSELLVLGKYDEAIAAYRKGSQLGFHFSSFTEGAINALGYELIGKGHKDVANELFILNSELFPSSGNVWDSLAESYLSVSKNQEAKMCWERALELNPENENAKAMLNKL